MTDAVILRKKGLGKNGCKYIANGMKNKVEVINISEEYPKTSPDFVFRWGTTENVAGAKQINTPNAICSTSDKRKFRKKLASLGLAPKFWEDLSSLQESGFKNPVIVRPAFHQRSEDIYLCETLTQIQSALDKIDTTDGFYISEYIPKVAEFRVFVAQNRAVWMIEKIPEDKTAITWGCIQDGDFEYVYWSDWNLAVVENAIRSFDEGPLHFGAVDVLLDKSGKAYTLEINTAPWLTPYYGESIGKVFDYMIDEKTSRFEINPGKSWKNFIHPAISKEAVL
ncbi:MAG: hypothetical protein AB7V06_25620 [Candidatus Obscuribacterales bacterium]